MYGNTIKYWPFKCLIHVARRSEIRKCLAMLCESNEVAEYFLLTINVKKRGGRGVYVEAIEPSKVNRNVWISILICQSLFTQLNIYGNSDLYLDCFVIGNHYRSDYCFVPFHCLNNWIPYQKICPMVFCKCAVRMMMWAMRRPFCACYHPIGRWLERGALHQRNSVVIKNKNDIIEEDILLICLSVSWEICSTYVILLNNPR